VAKYLFTLPFIPSHQGRGSLILDTPLLAAEVVHCKKNIEFLLCYFKLIVDICQVNVYCYLGFSSQPKRIFDYDYRLNACMLCFFLHENGCCDRKGRFQ